MKMSYKEIKKELLKDGNILDVNVSSTRKRIEVKPVQNKSFFDLDAPLAKYIREGEHGDNEYGHYFLIGGKKFKRIGLEHSNTTIHSITLKEIH